MTPLAPESVNFTSRSQRRPGDAVNRNTAELPDDQRIALRWLHAYGDEKDLTNKALGEAIGYAESTISRLYGAEMKYEGNLDAVCDAIAAFRAKVDAERTSKAGLPFIETSLSRHIRKIADAAVEYNRIVYMFGETQIGKSRTLREIAEEEKGDCYLWEMPVGGSLSHFLANGAKATRMSARGDRSVLRRRLLDNFDGKSKIIIDQMHRCFADARGNMLDDVKGTQMATLDFIIELFDAHEPGIILCGSNVFRDGISEATRKNFFRQLRGRSLNPEGFQLPGIPSKADLNAFAKHYKLPPATGTALEVQSDIIEKWGLAVLLTRLASGAKRARKENRAMEWDDMVRAHDVFTKLGRNEQQEAA